MPSHEGPNDETPSGGRAPVVWVLLRVGLALLPLLALYLAVRASGVLDGLDVERVRRVVQDAGPWRVPLFVGIYGVGLLVHVPGSVFVGGGVLAFGAEWGLAWSYLGALLGNLLSFGIVRLTGHRPLVHGRWPVAERLFRQLAERPLQTVILLRALFPTTAPINYALALTSVTLPVYVLGSSIGVLPQLVASVWLFALILPA